MGDSVECCEEPFQVHIEGGRGATDCGYPRHGGRQQRVLQGREAEGNESLQQFGMSIEDFGHELVGCDCRGRMVQVKLDQDRSLMASIQLDAARHQPPEMNTPDCQGREFEQSADAGNRECGRSVIGEDLGDDS